MSGLESSEPLTAEEQVIVDEAVEESVIPNYPTGGFLEEDLVDMSRGNKWVNRHIETYRECLREALGLDPSEEGEEDPLSLAELEMLNKLQTHESLYIPTKDFEETLKGEGLGLDTIENGYGELELTEDPHRMSHIADAVSGVFSEPRDIFSEGEES